MKAIIFCHSVLSDRDHGAAHQLRGLVTELTLRGGAVRVYEPREAWGQPDPPAGLSERYPHVDLDAGVVRYEGGSPDLDAALGGVDLVLVHASVPPALVEELGRRRAAGGDFILMFHDTSSSNLLVPVDRSACDLSGYDAVLASTSTVKAAHEARGQARRVFVWHDAADPQVFRPMPTVSRETDVLWVGPWGDADRAARLRRLLLDPVRDLGLTATAHGPGFPLEALDLLPSFGVAPAGWLPSHAAPDVYARHRVCVHVPTPAQAIVGAPAPRVFEALACGIPLICAPWVDVDGMFEAGVDFLVAEDGDAMRTHLRDLLGDPDRADALARSGRRAVLARHTIPHRVDELTAFYSLLGGRIELEPVPTAFATEKL